MCALNVLNTTPSLADPNCCSLCTAYQMSMAQTVANEKQLAVREEHMAAEQQRARYGNQAPQHCATAFVFIS